MKILVLPGDGIGPEITDVTMSVLTEANRRLDLGLQFEMRDIGLVALRDSGSTLPEAVIDEVPKVDGVILGPVSHYEYPSRAEGGLNPSGELRTRFKLYANIRPCRSREDLTVLRRPMDLVIVRENTEGFYSDRNMYAGQGEFMSDENSAFSIRKVTATASSAVARAAFDLARERRRKVTAVHKANVMKLTDGLLGHTTDGQVTGDSEVGLADLLHPGRGEGNSRVLRHVSEVAAQVLVAILLRVWMLLAWIVTWARDSDGSSPSRCAQPSSSSNCPRTFVVLASRRRTQSGCGRWPGRNHRSAP